MLPPGKLTTDFTDEVTLIFGRFGSGHLFCTHFFYIVLHHQWLGCADLGEIAAAFDLYRRFILHFSKASAAFAPLHHGRWSPLDGRGDLYFGRFTYIAALARVRIDAAWRTSPRK